MHDRKNLHLGLAIYRKDQWEAFLASADDLDLLETTWEEWNEVIIKTKKEMAVLGITLIDVIIDIEELNRYCREQNLPNNGDTRSYYVREKLHEKES